MSVELNSIFVSKDKENRLYQVACPIIGLTGGIATGKSSVSRIFEHKDLSVICADQLVKEIYETESAIEFVKEKFPAAIKQSQIDFKILREQAFTNSSDKTLIENFIYSKLPDAFLKKVSSFNDPSVIIYDVPLLFEKGLDKLVDVSICVYCPEEEQKKRLLTRDGNSDELVKSILSSQMPIEEKKENSDFVINNSGQEKNLPQKVEEIMALIFE